MPFVYKNYMDFYRNNEIQVDFSHNFFLIERPSNSAHVYGLIKNYPYKAHLYK